MPPLFIIAALFLYWANTHQKVVRCVLGDAICSLTVATYTLCILTAMLFAGSFFAAVLAKREFDHGRRAGLALQRCERDNGCPSERYDAYLFTDQDSLVFREPEGFDLRTWGVVNFDCISIGRAPLVGSIVRANLHGSDDAETLQLHIPVGSLTSASRAHYAIYVGPTLSQDSLEFVEAVHDHGNQAFTVSFTDTILKVKKRVFKPGDEVEEIVERLAEETLAVPMPPEAPKLPEQVRVVHPEEAQRAEGPTRVDADARDGPSAPAQERSGRVTVGPGDALPGAGKVPTQADPVDVGAKPPGDAGGAGPADPEEPR